MRSQKKPGQDRVTIVGRWQSIPVSMLRDTTLSSDQRMLCALLYTYAGNDGTCYPLQQTLADQMGVGIRRIQAWLKTLHNAGYVDITRTLYGNLYTLREPHSILTNTIPGSHAKPINGSPHTIPGSHGEAIPGSHASFTESHHDSESPHTPPTPPEVVDDDSTHDSIRSEDERVGKLLKKAGVGAWRKLQTKLAGVDYELIERRVNTLINQGKGPAIIYTSLHDLPFTPGTMDEAGPIPLDREYWHSQGFSMGGDAPDKLQQMLEMSDPELKAYFEECGL